MDPESNDIDDLQSGNEQTQQDEVVDQSADLEQQQGAESDTASEPEHEQNAAGGEQKQINQEAIDAAIAKQHAKYREEQRLRQAAEKRLQEFESMQSQNADPEPQIPEVDPYSDNLEAELSKRDNAIREHIQWQQRQQQRQQQIQQQQYQTQQQQQAEAQQRAESFFKRAAEDKIDQQALNQAVQTVGQFQLGHEVAQYLMDDEKGHQVTLQLAKQPALLADLALMSPYERILHIERNVRSKVKSAPRQSNGNPPPKRVKGRASDVSDTFPLTGGRVTVE